VYYYLEELTMALYCGIDLHSTNHWLTVIDETDRRVYESRLANDLAVTLAVLEPYRAELVACAVESTFNWYWLVDGLMQSGYEVKLVNTSAVRQYDGLKHSDDRHDAFQLAHLLRLGILPTGYIYPKRERALRDLLRQRTRLVQQRTTHVLNVKSTVARQSGVNFSSAVILGDKAAPWPILSDPNVALAVEAHRPVIEVLNEQIARIEREVRRQLRPDPRYELLQTVRGIGPVLAWTILLEAGDIHRFASVGNFASYCRCVQSRRLSNGKKKGEANKKNGNPYLAWAFLEAAHFALRFEPAAKRFFERKRRERNAIVAIKALAHKLARACYFILRDGVPFMRERLFRY
jgi:transposase